VRRLNLETLPGDPGNLFLTTEAHDSMDHMVVEHLREEHPLELVCEEKESYPQTYRSGPQHKSMSRDSFSSSQDLCKAYIVQQAAPKYVPCG